MRFSRFSALGLAFALAMAPALLGASNRDETLDAIHRVENPRDSTRPGKHGELGAYQFRRGTWRMYTKVPFERALDRNESEEVAVRHYEWLRRGLARNGLPQTPYYIALAWNGGLASVVNGRSPKSAHDYAARVSNLVVDLKTNPLALAP
jgi:hypothetical protein